MLQQMADIKEEQVVAVQRIAVLQATGEKPPTGGPEDQLPLDSEVRASLLQEAQRTSSPSFQKLKLACYSKMVDTN